MEVELSNEMKTQLYESGCFLVFVDFPEGAEFGIDFMSWTVGPKFKGLKMIPPGLHFVYFSCQSSPGAGDHAPRIGFFHNFQSGDVLVRKWDKKNEDLLPESAVAAEEVERLRANLKDLDSCLGPYPFETYKKWYSLAGHITADLAHELSPETGRISTQCELVTQEQLVGDANSNRVDRAHPVRMRFTDAQGLPIMKVKPDSQLRFHAIPLNRVPTGAHGSEVTKHSLDATSQLQRFLQSAYPDSDRDSQNRLVLGELQFAFVVFLVGQVYAGFEQWKHLLHLLCSCVDALRTQTELYMQFLMVLHFQLKECPRDFFVDIVTRDNFLTESLGNLFANLETTAGVDEKLLEKARKFKLYLTKQFKWKFDAVNE